MNSEYLKYRNINIKNSRKYYKENLDMVKMKHRNRSRDRKINGKCVACGKLLSLGEKYRCLLCRKKHSSNTKSRREFLRGRGLCWTCHKPLDNSGNMLFCKNCAEKENKRRKLKITESKQRCVEFLGSKCSVCGLKTEFLSVYDFHHKNPTEKEKGIRSMLNNSWESLEQELRKCILVCANCHRIIHFENNK